MNISKIILQIEIYLLYRDIKALLQINLFNLFFEILTIYQNSIFILKILKIILIFLDIGPVL